MMKGKEVSDLVVVGLAATLPADVQVASVEGVRVFRLRVGLAPRVDLKVLHTALQTLRACLSASVKFACLQTSVRAWKTCVRACKPQQSASVCACKS